jgi:hypothetical protein
MEQRCEFESLNHLVIQNDDYRLLIPPSTMSSLPTVKAHCENQKRNESKHSVGDGENQSDGAQLNGRDPHGAMILCCPDIHATLSCVEGGILTRLRCEWGFRG